MAKNRRQRIARVISRRHDAGRPVPPTRQTLRRLKGDTVLRCVRRGHLSPHLLDAALEIRAIHAAVGRGFFPTSQLLRFGQLAGQRTAQRDFLDRMTSGERSVWERRYIPWCVALDQPAAARPGGATRLEIVIAVVVDNLTLREAETRYRLQKGDALPILEDGLDQFQTGCALSGVRARTG